MSEPTPTDEDRANYGYKPRESTYYKNPGEFLKLGDRVRAKFRIWDQPNVPAEHTTNGKEWGWISAEKGEEGVVVHQQDKTWPTVMFANGRSTCVVDFEVEKISL